MMEKNVRKTMRPLIIGAIALFVVICIVVVVAIAGGDSDKGVSADGNGAEVTDSVPEETGAMGGLMNPDNITEPELITKEDLEKEAAERKPITMEVLKELEYNKAKYLTVGDFEGLDAYLEVMQATYKSATGADAQALPDWDGLIASLRRDVTAVVNVAETGLDMVDSVRKMFFVKFYDPEILAAAMAYLPIDYKWDVFLATSWAEEKPVYLPSVPGGTNINLRAVDWSDVSDDAQTLLAAIDKMDRTTDYSGVYAYYVTLFGYEFCVYLAMTEQGWYTPMTMENTDGLFVSDYSMSYQEMGMSLMHQHANSNLFDDLIVIPELDRAAIEELKAAHPEYFNGNGVYTGPEELLPSVNYPTLEEATAGEW